MVWVPKDTGRPHIICCEFSHGQPVEIRHTGCSSSEEALQEYQSQHGYVIETELIVLPSKFRGNGRFSHTLKHLEPVHPTAAFIAIIEARQLRALLDKTNAERQKRSKALRQAINEASHDTGKARFDVLPDRLKARIQIQDSGCWLWFSSSLMKRGKKQKHARLDLQEYGQVSFEGKKWKSHKLVYTLLVGEVPSGAMLCHACDTPACVNPQHLRLGTCKDNADDRTARKRHGSDMAIRRQWASFCKRLSLTPAQFRSPKWRAMFSERVVTQADKLYYSARRRGLLDILRGRMS